MSGWLPMLDQDEPSNLGFFAADEGEDEDADEDEAMMKDGTFNNNYPK